MKIEYLPCPFCGAYPDIFSNGDTTCSTEMCPGYDVMCSKDDWNKRAPSLPAFDTEQLGKEFAQVIEDNFDDLVLK